MNKYQKTIEELVGQYKTHEEKMAFLDGCQWGILKGDQIATEVLLSAAQEKKNENQSRD